MRPVVKRWQSTDRVSRGPTCYTCSRHQIKGCGRKRAPPSIVAGHRPPQTERGLPRSQVLTVSGPMTHHTTRRSALLITKRTYLTLIIKSANSHSSNSSVGLAVDAQPPQAHPQPPRHRHDGLLAAAGVGHQLAVAPRG